MLEVYFWLRFIFLLTTPSSLLRYVFSFWSDYCMHVTETLSENGWISDTKVSWALAGYHSLVLDMWYVIKSQIIVFGRISFCWSSNLSCGSNWNRYVFFLLLWFIVGEGNQQIWNAMGRKVVLIKRPIEEKVFVCLSCAGCIQNKGLSSQYQ
jgi:hypothetical protein